MKEKVYLEDLKEEIKERYLEGLKKMDKGRFEEAGDIFVGIIDEKPGFVPVFNKLAVIHIYRKELDKAREWLEKALDIDDEFAPAVTNLGSIKKEEGDRETAKKLYQKAIEINPDYGPAYNNLGVIYREEGNYRKSVKNLKKANKLNSYAINIKKEKPLYKEPGCLVGLVSLIIIVVLSFILFR